MQLYSHVRTAQEPAAELAPELASMSSNHAYFRLQLATLIAAGITLLSLALAIGFEPPMWFQPTCVGVLWCSAFLAGCLLHSRGRGRLPYAGWSLAQTLLATVALQQLTDIARPECVLVMAVLAGAGWLTSFSRPVSASRQHGISRQHIVTSSQGGLPARHGSGLARRQFSIWDLVFLTTLVACFCNALTQPTTSLLVMVAVGTTLAAAVSASWIASRWAECDAWNVTGVVWLLLFSVFGLAVINSIAPADFSVLQSLRWMLAGPINVVATQATLVLLCLGLLRGASPLAVESSSKLA